MARWGYLLGSLVIGLLVLAACGEQEAPPTTASSLLAFRYDAARDVVIAMTYPLVQAQPPTAQQYADALARRTEASFVLSPAIRLAAPVPTVADGVLTVNYREAAGLAQLSSAQATAVLAALEGWRWVPGVRQVRVQGAGAPLTTVGPLTLTQPLAPAYHTYVVQPQTGEVGYLAGTLMPANLTEAVDILTRREISEFPATRGFLPLLPPGATLTAHPANLAAGTLPVDLSATFPRAERARLAGILLTVTQFPDVEAVRLTFGGQIIDEMFMRGRLDAPLTPYALLLPAETGAVATGATLQAVRTAAQSAIGHTPAQYGTALVWRDWAAVTVQMTEEAPAELFVAKKQAEDRYTVEVYGDDLPLGQLLQNGVPRDAIIALRLPGWETLARE